MPNLVLKPQLRLVTLGGERLTLRAVISTTNGAAATSRLEWQRAGAKGLVKLPVDDYARGGKLAGRLLRGPLEEGS